MKKKVFFLLIALVGLLLGYEWYFDPNSFLFGKKKPSAHRLSPPGTYYLLEYVSVKKPSGMVGITPGQEVHRVSKANVPAGKMQVSDGTMEFEVDRAQLTDDMDLADSLRQQDQDGQSQAASALDAQRLRTAQKQAMLDTARAEDLDRINKANAEAAAANASAYKSPLQGGSGLSGSSGLSSSGVGSPAPGKGKGKRR